MAVCVFCGKKEIGPFPINWKKLSLKLTAKRGTGENKRAFGGGFHWVACNSQKCKEAMERFYKLVDGFAKNVEGGVRENLRSRKV
jgi:hypothetical protein